MLVNSLFIKRENNQNQPENNQNSPGIQQEPTRNQSEIARKPPGIEKNCVVLDDVWWFPDEFLVGSGRFWSFYHLRIILLKSECNPLKMYQIYQKKKY